MTDTEPKTAPVPRRVISGTPVVIAMLTFGTIVSGALWIYWHYHTAPFIPLQVAIANEFHASAPRVDGGQRKMHKGTPKLLWIVMRVQFNPEEDAERARKVADRVVELSGQHLDLTQFEQLNLREFFGEPEKVLHRVDYEVPLDDGTPGDVRLIPDDEVDETASLENRLPLTLEGTS